MKRVPSRGKESPKNSAAERRLKKAVARFEKMVMDGRYSGKRTPKVD